jgi:hypothetical protein
MSVRTRVAQIPHRREITPTDQMKVHHGEVQPAIVLLCKFQLIGLEQVTIEDRRMLPRAPLKTTSPM